MWRRKSLRFAEITQELCHRILEGQKIEKSRQLRSNKDVIISSVI